MDTNIITWIVLGIFALFIFFKFRKFLPFKQDARSINYYHTDQHPVEKERVIREVRTVKKLPAKREVIEDDDVEQVYRDIEEEVVFSGPVFDRTRKRKKDLNLEDWR